MCSNHCSNRPLQQGVALILVLWLLVLLSTIAMYLSTASRTEARISSHLLSGAQARYAADAGLQWAVWSLSLPADKRWLADGSTHEMLFEQAVVRVSMQDENGKYNLNSITPAQLLALFAAAEIDEGTASIMSDRILDWRDKDDLKRLNGAEQEDYEQAGSDYVIGDRLFRSVEELRTVLGMEEWIYQKISPALSTKARTQGVNPLVAPYLVLLSMPGATDLLVNQYIEQRRSDYEAGLAPKGLTLPLAQFIPVTTPGLYYTIETESILQDGAGIRQRASLVRNPSGQQQQHRITDIHDLLDSHPPDMDCSGKECPE